MGQLSRVSWWKRGLGLLIIAVAVVAACIAATLPPAHLTLSVAVPPTIVYGGYHVHTRRSDGSGTPAEIARAASRAGLKFVILTDHGDGTRPADPPTYIDGVLMIDAIEVSTHQGHVVALGMKESSPYPLGGDARDVVDDIHRLGGFAIVAHPDSAKSALRWTAWQSSYDGVEWLNADSEWRDDPAGRVLATALRSLVRGPESVAQLFTRPAETVERWDETTTRRQVVALAALDVHARGAQHGESSSMIGDARFLVPGYEEMFRTLQQAVELEEPLSNNPLTDATALIDALRRGRTYSTVTAFGGPAVLSFTASQQGRTRRMGDRLVADGEPVTFSGSVAGAPDAVIELWSRGRKMLTRQGSFTFVMAAVPGATRVEAFLRDRRVPWVFSNPIYAGDAPTSSTPTQAATGTRLAIPPSGSWSVEHAPGSIGAVRVEGDELTFSYGLAGGSRSGQYAGLVTQIASAEGFTAIELVARAEHPMRASVQLRAPDGGDGRRWQQSIYLDARPRLILLPVEGFAPTGAERPSVDAGAIRSLLFVVDTTNTAPGSGGTVWISHVALVRPAGQ